MMKKFFLLTLAAMTSLTVLAGANDLLWSYDADHAIPSTSPDNGLYYGSYVNDAAGTNLSLHGVKLNGSGYAFFAKAAVAGKLKLTFSNRKATTAYEVSVYKCTITDGTATKGDLIADLSITEGPGSASCDIAADVEGIYITRKTGSEGVLTKIEFTETIAREFTDFKIDFRTNPYTVIAPEAGLPANVTLNVGTYKDAQHGTQKASIIVPVDGTVKFTIGGCKYTNKATVTNKAGVSTDIATKTSSCENTVTDISTATYNVYATYLYVANAGTHDTLTFDLGNYCSYFFAEATEVKPATITYKDQNGNTLATKSCYEGDPVGEVPDSLLAKLTIPEGFAFRGWVYASKVKSVATDIVSGDMSISASVTPIESATVGSIQTYNLTQSIFYPEDHETFAITNASYKDATHGWDIKANGSFSVDVAGKAEIILTECKYGSGTKLVVTDANGTVVCDSLPGKVATDGATVAYKYNGTATRLTFTCNGEIYIHKIQVFNVQDFLEKDAATGYYLVPAGDGAAFVLALLEAQKGDKIYLPNGTYDLAKTVLTAVSKDSLSIIGESMEGVVIKNQPDAENESINNTATLYITDKVKNTYLQDLTLENDLDYYKADSGRAVTLWDKGTQTVCKNVKLMSYQDTYYSNYIGAKRYFEDGEIHGTVDYICGDGSVWFEGVDLICEKRAKAGGGSDAVTASNADKSDRGYVFNNCKLQYAAGITGTLPVVSLGRSWNNAPQCVFLNTTVDNTNGTMSFTGSGIQRWTLAGMNVLPQFFGEYNTKDENGTVISPDANNVTFTYKTDSKAMNTILSADTVAQITMANFLGNWAATAQADAAQVTEMPAGDGIFLVDGAITTVKPTSGKCRVANRRGGFGPEIDIDPTAIDRIEQAAAINKMMVNGQLMIQKGEHLYNAQGVLMK